ncbi:class F sortase [Streptomyces caniscabiei]|uniref:Class F sortase n=1 Tax=Streptomyces caniscabiei TaxID=2746961 RepID=A0ABU4N464_9ACTN|nr:class F sortase [Streptomyces caniscabiei]MBE4734281.1 class F sortase [Streptomyces caniscabiei]MBE4755152.1 class F sortase [Streptomyces caniscabiei]MBE4771131.1 class F sortase [Streptomyces caniscabiei]MBE4783563.1 class F sortase [Streptomyces caniscabiei]MBE4792867.1 class F sortase [Streptomyces caniscabiei]
MTPLSRRAFAVAAAASLLVSCDDGGTDRATAAPPEADTPPSAPHPSSSSSAGGAVRPLGRSVPVRLLIPAIGVDTPVIRLGLAPDGTVEVPPVTEHDRAGWYRHSPTPGQTGPSVILGHVTVGRHGDGVFRELARLRRGERIEARLENGTTAEFTVASVRTVAKADFPADEVYGNVSRPALRLITCGGPRTGEEYRDNVIVFATLSSTAR